MSTSERAMYAHLLIDALLSTHSDQCQMIVDALKRAVEKPYESCSVDGHILVLWDGATSNDGLYDKDAAKHLVESLEDLCGLE